jgi:hypothetical protein
MVEELVQRLQGCSTSPKRSTPRRHSSSRNSPSTTPVRSARRISSRGELKQSPISISSQGEPSNENLTSLERRTTSKPLHLSIRTTDRDIFGPVQINGINKGGKYFETGKQSLDTATKLPSTLKDSENRSDCLQVGKLALHTASNEDTVNMRPQQVASRFGTPTACPGCHLVVSSMEMGVVPGPQGTRWHAACLVCGGKRKEQTKRQDGCGKKLDSSAKTDKVGRLFCRNCLVKAIFGYFSVF